MFKDGAFQSLLFPYLKKYTISIHLSPHLKCFISLKLEANVKIYVLESCAIFMIQTFKLRLSVRAESAMSRVICSPLSLSIHEIVWQDQ